MELQKFCEPQVVNEQQRWLRFFKEGAQLNDDSGLPDWMTTQEMRQAMKTLKQFSEKDPVYLSITNAANITFLKSQVDDLIGLKQIVNDLSVKVEQNSTTISDLGQSLTITSQELVGANKAQMAGKEPIPQATGLE